MDPLKSERDLFEQVAESFLARFRRGERPSLSEYAARYPDLAGQIGELFPLLVEMEGHRPGQQAPVPTAQSVRALGPDPQQLDDYLILREIGRGGMGVVYEAEQLSLGRRVALKLLPEQGPDSTKNRQRFEREARAAAKLHHTNIVPVFAIGEHEGRAYYVMQYIQGHGLDEVIDELLKLQSGQVPAEHRGPHLPSEPSAADMARSLLTGGLAATAPQSAVDQSAGVEIDVGSALTIPAPLERAPEAPSSATDARTNGGVGRSDNPSHAAATAPKAVTPTNTRLSDLFNRAAPDESGTDQDAPSTGPRNSNYWQCVARIGLQVAEALAYAHKHGILHRDIKPSNLLLDTQETVWVTDFGLAKVEDKQNLTHTGDLLGTLRYMPPEALDGKSDKRSDVYGLGLTLYEMLAMRPAFGERERNRLIKQITSAEPVRLGRVNPAIPRDLATIVQKAIEREPDHRYATAEELAADLRRFLDDAPIQARRIGSAERLYRWCRRNPLVAGLNALAATLTILIAIGSTIAASIYRDQRNTLEIEQGKTQTNLTRAVSAEKAVRDQLVRTQQAERHARLAQGQSLVSEGAALQRTGLIGQRFESLDRLRRAAKILGADPESRKRLPEIRNQAIAALGLTDLRERRQRDCGDVCAIGVDVALERYAVMDWSGAVVVRRLDDDRELLRLPAPDRRDFWHANLAFSPDGELLATTYFVSEVDRLRIWHLGARKLLGSLEKRHGTPLPRFHPDGRRLLFNAPEGGIAIWDRVDRRVVRRLALDFAPSFLALDPDGRRLAVNSADDAAPRVMTLELETGRVLADWRSQVGAGALAWSADGQLLAIGGAADDPRVYVWSVHRGVLASVLQGHTNWITDAQFARSGNLLATTSFDYTTRLWDAASGEPLVTAPGGMVGLAPDDRRLAFYAGGKIGVREVAAGAECRILHPGMVGNRTEPRNLTGSLSADVSPDGRLLAIGGGDGVRLWEADLGRELAHLKTGHCDTVLFHPDGQSLISSGPWGLYRWPIRPAPDDGSDAIRVGPPELLRETASNDWSPATWLPDHRILALIDNPGARVWLVDSSHPHPAWSRATALDSGENRRMRDVAASPDGSWLAVGGWKEAGVRVWDLRRRRLERILRPNDTPVNASFFVGFSPDGRWLVASTFVDLHPVSYHFWRTGTWEPGQTIIQDQSAIVWQPPAFTADGRMMALAIAPDQVLLADAATGRELARLTTLQSVTPTPLVFSPDGTKLVAKTADKTVLLWDLRMIRDQLAPMGLDWDAPPYPPASTASEASGPVPPRPVRVIGEVIEPQVRRAGELAAMNRRLAANPADADALIHRGWLFHHQRKWPAAIADLEGFLRFRPANADACWLLAEAYEETGNLTAALAAFSRRLERAPEDRDARLQRGRLALALAQPELAVDDFTRILAAEPDLERARYRRAQALTRLGRHREALADLDILIPKAPQDDALYQLRGTVREALGDSDRARRDREKAGALLPRHPRALNDRAWVLATGSIDQRDAEEAVALARQAVALAPGQQVSLNTLGVALYRAGQYTEAVAVLEQSLAAGKGEYDAFDLFFLAMAHRRLGHATQARARFDRAVVWLSERTNLPAQYVTELTRFRAEAEVVLGLDGPSAELPADVFAPE